jgi:homoserine O-acetyltransferase/O-succinyltransferase
MTLAALHRVIFSASIVLLSVTTAATTAPAADGEQQSATLGNCKLSNGEQIIDCQLGYRTWGTLNANRTNAVLVTTWFTGTTADLVRFVGPEGIVDPTKYFVVAVDALGNGVSASPSNSKAQPRTLFPSFAIRDMVDTEYRLVTEILHLKHLHAVIGMSMGGMQAFQWIASHPEFLDVAVPIVGSPRQTAYDLALWHGEEDAIRSTPAWQGGWYDRTPAMPMVALLHDTHLTTPAHYASEIGELGFAARYAEYETRGAADFDANDRLYQLEAMVHQNVGAYENVARRVHLHVLVVAAEQDHMVNPGPALEFARALGSAGHAIDFRLRSSRSCV